LNGDLTAFNTLRLPALADRLVLARDRRTVLETVVRARAEGSRLVPVGGGSNLVLQRRVPATVCVLRTRGLRFGAPRDGRVEVAVEAGENWHGVVRACLGRGLGGLENLALIPGSAGAAPIQNIGAYGVEFSELCRSVTVVDLQTGLVEDWSAADCRFGYRDSRFKAAGGRYLVLSLRLALPTRWVPRLDYGELAREVARSGRRRPGAVEVAEAVIRVRRRKLPDVRRVGNVGSFFKNPQVPASAAAALQQRYPELQLHPLAEAPGHCKLAAAQLIDLGGWKRRPDPQVGLWPRQALVLVNRGGATGAQVLAYAERIQQEVLERCGVALELEPAVLGEP